MRQRLKSVMASCAKLCSLFLPLIVIDFSLLPVTVSYLVQMVSKVLNINQSKTYGCENFGKMSTFMSLSKTFPMPQFKNRTIKLCLLPNFYSV